MRCQETSHGGDETCRHVQGLQYQANGRVLFLLAGKEAILLVCWCRVLVRGDEMRADIRRLTDTLLGIMRSP